MVCITGDVHQRSYRGTDTPFSKHSEVELALKYARIAEQYSLRITLFLTGRSCLEEPTGVQRLAEMPHCEIGGHTFAAFRDPWSRVFRKVYGTPWGTLSHQSRDIVKTVDCLQKVTGKRITVWRNHSYVNSPESPDLLGRAGIRWISDEVNADKRIGEPVNRLVYSLPINVLPDHEHLLHGKYLLKTAKPSQLLGRVSISQWIARVKTEVETVINSGGVATILAHPLCMEVADGMLAFEELCRFLQSFPSCWVSMAPTQIGMHQ